MNVKSRKREVGSEVAVRGDCKGGIPGEEKLVGTPKFHSCGNYIMPLTNTVESGYEPHIVIKRTQLIRRMLSS